MKFKKLITFLGTVALTAVTPLTTISTLVDAQENGAPTVATDFYQAVNHEWLESATIPADKPAVDNFSQITDEIDTQLKADLEKMATGELEPETPELAEMVKLYQLAKDIEARNEAGVAEVLPYFEKIQSLTSVANLNEQIQSLLLDGYSLPFDITVSTGLEDSSIYEINLVEPALILPDKTMYEDEETGQELLSLFEQTTVEVLKAMGFSQEESAQHVQQAIAFDALLVPLSQSSEEFNDIDKIYNIRSLDDVTNYSKNIAIGSAIQALVSEDADNIVVYNPTYFEHFDEVVNDEQFENMKSWMIVDLALEASGYLTEELANLGAAYGQALQGIQKPFEATEFAYDQANDIFGEVLGVYYGHNYFGEDAKKDVENMVHEIIDVYKTRFEQNDWLSQATRDKAIEKLSAMKIHIGYPEKLSPLYSEIKIDESQSLFSNFTALSKQLRVHQLSKYGEKADIDGDWGMPAHTVNAFYNGTDNGLYFPAAILQAPFYSSEQTISENYGGIGAVIGHEITHAFDTQGSKFDKDGKMTDWWTDEDYQKFAEKAQAMIDLWDGIEVEGGTVNGTLSVTENIADAGGVSAALAALKQHEEADLSAFFMAWARNWRQNIRPELASLIMATDPHPPSSLRGVMPAQQLEEFYETFNITEQDPMYIAPEKRVNIW